MNTQHVAQKKFKLEKRIGSGAFGDIYEGHELMTGKPVAIKLEKVSARYPQLGYEARIYHALQNDMHTFIPKMHYFGTEGAYNILVLDRLGNNMEQVRATMPNQCFKLKHIKQLAQNMLHILESFHDKGFVHRDIKPENILTSYTSSSLSKIYLIDFGLSKYMRHPVSGIHIPFKTGKNLTGTPRYASIANHKGREQGRRDDIEGLGYVLLYLLYGSLPWQHLQNYSKILEEKQKSLRTGKLGEHMPSMLRRFFRYVFTLNFEDRPNYNYMRSLFQ